jgi:UPF0755 protein
VISDTDTDADPRGGRAREAHLERRRRRRRRILVPIVFLSPLLILVAVVYGWWRYQLDPPGGPGDTVTVTVASGAGVRDIGKELAHEKVIGSSFAFDAYVRIKHAGPFDAGEYHLRKHLGIQGAVDLLDKGPVITYETLRITPGLWLSEVAAHVHAQLPWISATDVLTVARSNAVRSKFEPANVHTLEGFLYPDTYRFTKHDTATAVVRTMVRRFDQIATAAGLGTPQVAGQTPYQVLTIASIVQEESGTAPDDPLIASVIDNRLQQNMLLQMDATVVYALQQRKASNTAADRANPSPYNTYVHTGLPPTPIGAITKTALAAAQHPAHTTYLYFVVAGRDGHSAFATTLAEHEQNVQHARELGLLQ